MKLTILDRIIISQLYPQKSNLIQMTLVEDITKKVKIGQEEIKEIELKVEPTTNGISYNWNKDKAKDLNVDFTKEEIELLKSQVEELDSKKEITRELLDICKRIKQE